MAGPQLGCVVVGAGLTAAKAVASLREGGYDGPVTVVGDEGELPYERPPLSKGFLQGTSSEEKVLAHPAEWYDEHEVTLHLADPATGLDLAGRQVRLRSGASVPYDRLLLSTGARARRLGIPGADLEGVHTLRTLADSRALRAHLGQGRRWVVVGGGWIGLEVAAAARGAGDEVTLLEAADRPLGSVLGARLGDHFAGLHREHGVDLRTGVRVEALGRTADGLVVRTDGGPVAGDLVLVAVGAVPNTELAAAAGLAVDNGVVVDERLRTSDPAVLAAGDLANARHATLGRSLRVEHWDNAIRQGRLAAATILGREEVYDWAPYFFTDQYDLGMEYVGHHGPDDRVVLRGDTRSGEFLVFWQDDRQRLTAAMNVNVWDVNDTLRGLLGRTVSPDRLADPAVALADL